MSQKLFCPQCGRQFKPEIRFCRDCGLALDRIVEIVNGDPNETSVTFKPNYKFIRAGIGLFILGTALGLLNALLRDLQLYPEAIGKAVFLFFVMTGMLLLGGATVFPKRTIKKKKRVNAEPGQFLPDGSTTARLPEFAEDGLTAVPLEMPVNAQQPETAGIGSVTENTTRKLQASSRD